MELLAIDVGLLLLLRVFGGSRLVSCTIPTGRVCHPSIIGAKIIDTQHQRTLGLWANHRLPWIPCLVHCTRALVHGIEELWRRVCGHPASRVLFVCGHGGPPPDDQPFR